MKARKRNKINYFKSRLEKHDDAPLTSGDLEVLIKWNEHKYVEFKERISTPRKIAKVMVAFDVEGGYVVIGVRRDGEIVGTSYRKEDIDNIVRDYIDPPFLMRYRVDEVSYKNKRVLIITVYPSPPPFVLKLRNGECYMRVGSSTSPVNCEQVIEYKKEYQLYKDLHEGLPKFLATETYENLVKIRSEKFLENVEDNVVNLWGTN